MDVTELTQNPAMLVAGLIGLLLVLWILLSLRGNRSRSRGPSRMVAAVEAERDVLRANHAVEIAALERKLNDVQTRAQKDMQAALRLKEAEKALEAVREEAKTAKAALAAANERLKGEGGELEAAKRRLAELEAIADAKAKAETELAAERETVARLRAELAQEATSRSAIEAERAEAAAGIERLTRERDEARTALEAEKAASAALQREAASRGSADADAAALKAEIARLTETLAEREATLASLSAREKSANETLSRLSYDSDGLRERVEAAERAEREASADAEKKEALLELRLQKIYALEGQLRDGQSELERTRRRAEAAETEARSVREASDGGDAAFKSRIGALEAELAKAGEEEQRLRAELDELRSGAQPPYEEAREIAEALSAAQAEAEELRAEVDRLRKSRAATVSPADIQELRHAIRTLAERFVGETAPPDPASMEPSLAEKIRAFKASRDAKVRRPLRISAPE